MQALSEALFYLTIAMDPRCTASGPNYRQCAEVDTEVVVFSSKFNDWGKYCKKHIGKFRPELTKIRKSK